MTYATVMVSMTLNGSNEACLAVAGDTAERFGARVIGIAAAEFSPPLYFTSGQQAQRLVDQEQDAVVQRMTELEAEFRDALRPRAKEIEWRSGLEVPSRFLLRQARAADILVAGTSQAGLSDPFALADPSDLLMKLGRPMIAVPAPMRWLDTRSILVGWKDRAELRRAVADALPLLQKARDVTIAEIIEDDESDIAARARLVDVAAWLARHGVTASPLVAEKRGDPAGQLECIAADVGAGLVVAGAYGHSRFREWVLGGVTRRLLSASTHCSLLSR